MIGWLTDFLKRHINPFEIILCQEVRELRSLYIYTYIFCFLRSFFYTPLYYIKYSYLIQMISIHMYCFKYSYLIVILFSRLEQ